MLVNEFLQNVEKTYYKYFPVSKCYVKLSKNLYCNIDITCFLASNKEELSGGYWDNDMFSIRFSIDTDKGQFNRDITENSELPENLKLESNQNSYLLKPNISYMAYGRKGISFRKTKGNAEKIINVLDKFFSKMHDELEQDIEANLIHDDHIKLLKEKMGV